jgi:RHS repeat-associated protein
MRVCLKLLICSRLLAASFDSVEPSTPEEIQSLKSGLTVERFVSASSGQPSLSETDLRVRGAQELLLRRTYIPPQIHGRYAKSDQTDRLRLGKALLQLETKGWVVYPHLWAGYNRNSSYFQVSDPSGFTLEFAISGTKGELKTAQFGMSNLQGDTPSSLFDLRNLSLNVEGSRIKIRWPDGTLREYVQQSAVLWRLERELLPNGKAIRYEYGQHGLHQVLSCDKSGKYCYASITKSGDDYIGSDRSRASLAYEIREIRGKYKKDGYEEETRFRFPVLTKGSNPFYTNSIGYNDRTLLTSYDAKDYPISCSYGLSQNTPARINALSTPSGTVSFSYNPAVAGKKSGSTTVTYPDGAQIVYRFNEKLLLHAIENWHEGKLINQKLYCYDEKQHIKSIETKDGNGALLIAKRFECDDAGNPILETHEGDFGTFSIRRSFDQSRLISESRDDGLEYLYAYLEETHLPVSKETRIHGATLRKTTYTYDEAYNLSEELEVGKTKTSYSLYNSGPHLHRVKTLEQRDWENTLIHKTEYTYDSWGNIAEEQHFGSNETLAYTIQRTYDEKGNLLSETNPLQKKALYQYDARSRCTDEQPISNGLNLHRTFDAKGRLISLKENDHETTFAYNASDELVEQTDYLGYTTQYIYDPVHGKPTQIKEPTGTTLLKYDAFGRISKRTDPLGATTQTFYNSYGDTAKIIYPEGGTELFDYYPNGLLKSHTDADGIITSYTYDPLARITHKTVGQLTTTYHYDAYHLIQEVDPAGFITEYKYDLQGRTITQQREGRITRYSYDPLGFLAREERGNRFIEYTNDPLGQVTAKSIDGLLNTSWQYDAAGNKTRVQKGDAITTFAYDAHNRLTQVIDPEGNQTSIQYTTNPQILIETTTDPIGVQTVKTCNPQGKLLKKEISGTLAQEFEYDAAHRLKKHDHLSFGHSPNGSQTSMTESGQRTTCWSYTPANRLSSVQKPDGTLLTYTYDPQGRLVQKGSRTFLYDAIGRLTGGSGFTRMLDPFGNILREEFSNGLWIETDYDDWDRPLVRRLPDGSEIAYAYLGPFLKTVTRLRNDGAEAYSQTYDQFDARGNPQSELGFIPTSYTYDALGRRTSQTSPYFSETIDYNPAGNLIRKGATSYSYDPQSQMVSQSDSFTATYDVHYNLIKLNGQDTLHPTYDLNGNLFRDGFVYDEFDQLTQAAGHIFTYDALGRRLSKDHTAYLYIDEEEIGAYEEGQPKELKICGSQPIAIEIDSQPFASITDVQGTIRYLIDPDWGTISQSNACDAFGHNLTDAIPYAYAGKRFDPTTGLVYFGKRFYDPTSRRWTTRDPLGPIDHSNLYQYVYNNPFSHKDPTGQFAIAIPLLIWGAEMLIPTLTACAAPIMYGALTGAVAYGGYKLVQAVEKTGAPALGDYYIGDLSPSVTMCKDGKGRRSSDEPSSPPIRGEQINGDGSTSPGNGFNGWKGKGSPSSGKGSWVRGSGKTTESIHPDLNHPEHGPHWDYLGPNFPKGARIYPDGTWEPK